MKGHVKRTVPHRPVESKNARRRADYLRFCDESWFYGHASRSRLAISTASTRRHTQEPGVWMIVDIRDGMPLPIWAGLVRE